MRAERASAWPLLRSLIRAERRYLLIAVAGAAGWTSAGIAVPTLVQLAIDRGMRPGDTGAIVRYGLFILGCAVALALMFAVWLYFRAVGSRRAEAELRERLFGQLQRLHIGYHDRVATGQLMGRMNSDLQQIQQFMLNVPDTVATLVLLIGVLALLIASNAVLGLLIAVLLALLALSMVHYAAPHALRRDQLKALEREVDRLASSRDRAIM